MKTPREKYENDPQYRQLVDNLTSLIHMAHFTPSELREACIYASIRYEQRRIRPMTIPKEVEDSLIVLNKWEREE